ncbi:MAG: class I SAM-dependent DNA methyltransferase, partial [bacterium]|nr:class I SAM-dependent DNA methyltransferase [bacterium]
MLSWNEIGDRATRFSREWADETRETGEYQSFWNEYFEVFGMRRRSVALYQKKVELLKGRRGFIDLFWPGTLLVEHKSGGEDLDAAFTQATDYFAGLKEEEKPRFVIVTDYKRFRLYDFEGEKGMEEHDFNLKDLSKHVRRFAFIAGYEIRKYKEQDPINIKAVSAIGKLSDVLHASNYPPDSISKLLTRFVFCFFADDTGIFNRDSLKTYLEDRTNEDGSDIGAHLGTIFEVLNTPTEKRQTTLDEDLAALPFVDGWLFSEHLPALFGDRKIRDMLLNCTSFDWSAISPAIFGSMFQSVMNGKARHDLGAHYTSEKNILKVISGLFLDELQLELKAAGKNEAKLEALWGKIEKITLLDPACGCGNFLVVAYRELRQLELEIIKRRHGRSTHEIEGGQSVLSMGFDVTKLSRLSVERMFGIEIESFPMEIARLSLWLVDHMANIELGDYFGAPFMKLPLSSQPHIVQGNALRLDWESVVPKSKLSYILGNPPFVSKQDRDDEQKKDMANTFGDLKGAGELDYVAAWYLKATDYIQNTNISVALVSTNSLTQGEQVGILWPELLKRGVKIIFAHRTFRWSNEASGKAAVHCIIIGFSLVEPAEKQLFDYEDPAGEPHVIVTKNINPYLIDSADVFITSRRKPIGNVPEAVFGSMPNDGGQFLFDDEKEKDDFLAKEPGAQKFIKPLISAKEYLQGGLRYCLWLKHASPAELQALPEVMRRVANVRQHRELSSRGATKALAATPYLFGEDRQPDAEYILIPRVSSESRHYVPFGFFSPDNIAGDTCIVIPGATRYHFGIIQSLMHMAWMRVVCGRLESRYRYSNELVYNNYPWPESAADEQKREVEAAAQAVLDARTKFPTATLADL